MTDQPDQLRQMISVRIRRMHAGVLGVAAGIVLGLALFAMTNILVLKGPVDGRPVGAHLELLGQFFPGYTVTFLGSWIGFAYGFIVGFILMYVGASIYNAVAGWRSR
jgi:tetrahydromethanopterin S-methyltransferase subunit G